MVRNTSSSLAFQVHLTAKRGSEDIRAVYWDDNYFELFPGEEREIGVSFARPLPGPVAVEVDGWNVVPTSALP